MTGGKRAENLLLCFCTGALLVLGVLMVWSASSVSASTSSRLGHDPAYFFKRQVLFLFLGLCGALLASRIDYDQYRLRIRWVLGGTLMLLVAVFVPGIRHTANGASRWIDLRLFTFQPSELAKFALLAYAAVALERREGRPDRGWISWLPMLLVLGVACGLILKEPDFGMAVVVAAAFVTVLFLGGIPGKLLGGLAATGAAGVVLAVIAKPYRMARLSAFLDPFSQARSGGYQVVQSLIAFSNGGLLGTGIGAGKQKLLYLPEMHTDYIIAVIGEELGFLGVAAVGACYLTFVWVGFRIGMRARDPFGRYLAWGIALATGIQALANMMVGLNILPPKGMVLPFLSYGGSSLVLHLAAVGVLLNISLKGSEVAVAEAPGCGRGNRRARVSGDRLG